MLKALLVVGNNIESGGVEAYLLNVLNHINRKDIEFKILVPGEIVSEGIANKFRELGCSFCVLHISETGLKANKKFIRYIKGILSSEFYDIVHINTANLRIEAICLTSARKNGVVIRLAHSHGTLLKKSFIKETARSLLRRIIVRNASVIMACSTAAAESLVGKKYIDRVKIAKNGIDAEKYRFNKEVRQNIRRKYGWNNRYVVGIIARITPEKNHIFLLEVMRRLVQIDEKSFLVIVGTGDKTYENSVKENIKKFKLEEHIQFLGEIDNVNEILQGIDLCVLPSIREALGIVNIEAQAAGLHCVCSDRVPREVDVTGLVEFISLEKSKEYWADRMSKYNNGYNRTYTTDTIRKHGYDITTSAEIVDKIYHGSLDI